MRRISKNEVVITICPGTNVSKLGPCYYYIFGFLDSPLLAYLEETEKVILSLYESAGKSFAKVFATNDTSSLTKEEQNCLSVYNSRIAVLNSRCYTKHLYYEQMGSLRLHRIVDRAAFLSGDYKTVDTMITMPYTEGQFDSQSNRQPVYLIFHGPFPAAFDSWLEKVSQRFVQLASTNATFEEKLEGCFKVLDYCGSKLDMHATVLPKSDIDWLNRRCKK